MYFKAMLVFIIWGNILNNNPFGKPRGMHPTGKFMVLASKTFAATLLSMRPQEHSYP